jgi:hypothetical protein
MFLRGPNMQGISRLARLSVVAAALVASSPALAAPPAPSAAAMASANEIVKLTGAAALFTPLIPGVIEQSKVLFLQQDPSLSKDLNEVAAQMRTDLEPRTAELTSEVAKIYTQRYSEAELKELLAFYNSPIGKKMVAEQSYIVTTSLKFAQDWANKLSEEVTAKMRDQLKKKGHAL